MGSGADIDENAIAIVGRACRVPGASSVAAYWNNLARGVESIRRLSDDELRARGVSKKDLAAPSYVKAAAVFDDLEMFDGRFFGFSPKESAILDPQHRHFLEVCFEALEDAGHMPEGFDGAIGVFGGSGHNAYMPYHLFTNPALMRSTGLFLVRHTGNDKDFLTTRVSYCLDLQGPSVNIQTACSTSLVAVHWAAQSLLAGESDLALAGGVTLELPHGRGYHFAEGEILSPDGHCRAFDAKSAGTVFGSGAGVVVLRRLEDALEDGDTIHAVVLSSAINNDGAGKVGYLAPSVDGQAAAIAEAITLADLSARDISYVECHGTGTAVGDPIEVTALSQAFRGFTEDKQFCHIGSVKTNIGHLDTAAGVASLIKVVEMMRHQALVATLHYESPNPNIDFERSPFLVSATHQPWTSPGPRRAGVSSLGVGGTNAHVILEEAPAPAAPAPAPRGQHPLVLSARSEPSAQALCHALADALDTGAVDLADAGYTLQTGRRSFAHQAVVVAGDAPTAAAALRARAGRRVAAQPTVKGRVAFMFPGGGAQYPNMARALYDQEPVFARAVEEGIALVKAQEGFDLFPLMFPDEGDEEAAAQGLLQATYALPALLCTELSYAALWRSWGLEPEKLIGHSLGEYACAQLAGVLRLEDALSVVALRGRLFDKLPAGAMWSVALSEAEVLARLLPGLDLAAVNAPGLCLVSGPADQVDAFGAALSEADIDARKLPLDVAAHSRMLEPVLEEFGAALSTIRFSPPTGLRWVSNLTGRDITDEEATDPAYWVRHLRSTVRFCDGVQALCEQGIDTLVEVGPGHALSQLSRLSLDGGGVRIISSGAHRKDELDAHAAMLSAYGEVTRAVSLDPAAFWGPGRRRVSLPTTPWEHQRHWVEPGRGFFLFEDEEEGLRRQADPGQWFYTSVYDEVEPTAPRDPQGERWLWFAPDHVAGADIERALRARGVHVVRVTRGDAFAASGDAATVRPGEAADHDALLAWAEPVTQVVWGWSLDDDGPAPERDVFLPLLAFGQALSLSALDDDLEVVALTRGDLRGDAGPRPAAQLVEGPLCAMDKEIVGVRARRVDLGPQVAAADVAAELLRAGPDVVALDARGARWSRDERGLALAPALDEATRFWDGVVLITGGLGGLGLAFAASLMARGASKVALLSRSGLPDPEEWDAYCAMHDARDLTRARIEAVRRLQAQGEVRVVTADVADAAALEDAVAGIEEDFGPVVTVLHAAGVLDDGLLSMKDHDAALAVLAPKVGGGRALHRVFGHGERAARLRSMVLFSSTSAALGPPGQADYVAANAYLNGLAARWAHEQPQARVLAVQWGIFAGTGMAARAYRGAGPSVSGDRVDHPLLSRCVEKSEHRVVYGAVFDVRDLWVLDEHRVRDQGAVLPGTGYLEMARAAFAHATGHQGPVELRDVFFTGPLWVDDESPREVRVVLSGAEDGGFGFVIESRAGPQDADYTEHCRGQVLAGGPERPGPVPPDEPVVRQQDGQGNPVTLPQEDRLLFGPRWKVVTKVVEQAQRAEVWLRSAADAPERQQFVLHPALLDMASGGGFGLLPGQRGDRLPIPLSYRRLWVRGPAGATLQSRVFRTSGSDDLGTLRVEVSDEDGLWVKAEGYAVRTVPAQTVRRAMAKERAPTLLDEWIEEGLTAEEGADALVQLWKAKTDPVVLVSPLSVLGMRERVLAHSAKAPRKAAPAASAGGTPREDGPRDDVERTLAGLWHDLLGAADVGLDDDFFDLGGQSLVAVRLFARIKKAYGVDLEISVLFDAPTIRTCAERIRQELGMAFVPDGPAAADAPRVAPAAPKAQYQCLVAIQRGAEGRTPFFCVHGAGGNVLNFRDLARHLGDDVPFYGLQAVGIDGRATPQTRIEDMAARYLEDVLSHWPEGPYLFGGYSGGGVVAFEMAQQLKAQGRDVDHVVFLDTFMPQIEWKPLTLKQRLEGVRREGAGYFQRRAKARVKWELDRLRTEVRLRLLLREDVALPFDLREEHLTRSFLTAAAQYHPQPYDGAVTLFRAQEVADVFAHAGRTLGWGPYVRDITIHEVPGDHDSLVREPNVQVLTSRLRALLEQAGPGRG